MEVAEIVYLVTAIVTFALGKISKKVKWVNNHLIPLQNLIIGIISAGIYYAITKDVDLVLAAIPLGVGGGYDIIHNLGKLFEEK